MLRTYTCLVIKLVVNLIFILTFVGGIFTTSLKVDQEHCAITLYINLIKSQSMSYYTSFYKVYFARFKVQKYNKVS